MPAAQRYRFSWVALLLAPLPALVGTAGLLLPSGPRASAPMALLVIAALGSPIAYAGTAGLAVALGVIGRWRAVTFTVAVATGLALAALENLPILYLSWSSSGPDSGPPIEPLVSYLLREWHNPLALTLAASGAITAALYHAIARRRQPPAPAAAPRA